MTPSFDDPDAGWTDVYAWARYRGPQPYPVPGGWVLNMADEGGMSFAHYPGVGDTCEHDSDVRDKLAADALGTLDAGAIADARNAEAWHIPECVYIDDAAEVEHYAWHLTIDGETIYKQVDPEFDDAWAACAEALARFDADEPLADIDVTPDSGTPADEWLDPEEREAKREEERLERRREANQSLGDFAGDSA